MTALVAAGGFVAFAATSASAATASLALSPGSGDVGSTVAANGSGFPVRTRGAITFGGVQVANVRTDLAGRFSTSFAVPTGSAGTVSVSVKLKTTSASASFSVTTATIAPSPSPTTSPSPSPSPSPSASPAPSPSPSPTATAVTTASYGPQSTIACPAGSVQVAPGTNTVQSAISAYPSGTSFCLGAGTYYVTSHISPKSNDTLTGVNGAIIDGSQWSTTDINEGLIWSRDQGVTGVTIRNLVVRSFSQTAINLWHAGAWTVDHNEVYGARIGVHNSDTTRVTSNRIHHNTQYGMAGYMSVGATVQNNELAYNNTCACHADDEGAAKWAETRDLSVIGNYVHDNTGNGLWTDGAYGGTLFDGNTVIVNDGEGIENEVSGSVIIRNNTITVLTGAAGIFISTSTGGQVYNNTIYYKQTATWHYGITLLYDATRTTGASTDLTNNSVHDNKVVLQGSATRAAGLLCFNVSDCSPWLNAKGNSLQGNTYTAPSLTGQFFRSGSTLQTFSQWQGTGFDTTGSIAIP